MVAIAMAAIAAALTRPARRRGAPAFVARRGGQGLRPLYAPFALLGAAAGRRPAADSSPAPPSRSPPVAVVSLPIFGTAVDRGAERRRRQPGPDQPLERPGRARRGRAASTSTSGRAVLGALAVAAIVGLLVAAARGFDWVRAAGWAAFARPRRVRLHRPLVPDLAAPGGGDLPRPGADRCDDPASPCSRRSTPSRCRYERAAEAEMRDSPEFDLIARDPRAARRDGARRGRARSRSGSATTPR